MKPLTIRFFSRFKRDIKRLKKQHKDMEKLKAVIRILASRQELPPACHDHPLKNDWADFRDCHIEPDWVLIYQIKEDMLTLVLARTGSHSELEL